MLSGVSLGTTPLDPLGNKLFVMLWSRLVVAVLLSHLMRIMYTLQCNKKNSKIWRTRHVVSKWILTV